MVQSSLQTELQSHAKYVKGKIGDQKLTQEQFDALVSFSYNVGDTGAQKVLSLVKGWKVL
jgi:GH24 family phage-related lysozyme (muramidase)